MRMIFRDWKINTEEFNFFMILPFLNLNITYEIFFWLAGIFFAFGIFHYVKEKIKKSRKSSVKKLTLTKVKHNPLLSPREHLMWEMCGTFNPAALMIDGRVHLLYRAVGGDGVSRVGYASSDDGLHFNGGDLQPIFAFEKPRLLYSGVQKYDPVMYPSGGSFGGVEDPRLTHIDGVVYMTFNAFDGWDYIRIGLSMISEEDFLKKKWNKWTKPRLLSPPGEIHKNWMIFPSKIRGKFAVLHSISPKVEIEYVDNLSDVGVTKPFIKSPVGARGDLNKEDWDTRVRGAGAPPIKTDKGWLVLYHANERNESHKYKLGAYLLDLKNPKKVIAKAILPILEPDEWYENDSKPGIVYVCGAIIKEDKEKGDSLYVYYGGGDKYVCAAHTNLNDILKWITFHGSIE